MQDIRGLDGKFDMDFANFGVSIQPFNLLTPLGSNGRKQGTITKIYSGMRTMPGGFRATEIKKTKGSESVRKAGLSDIAGTCQFFYLL